MTIQYRFSIDGRYVSPHYSSDMSKEYEMESQQRFFRKKLSGKLTFVGIEYDWIKAKTMDDKMTILLEKTLSGSSLHLKDFFVSGGVVVNSKGEFSKPTGSPIYEAGAYSTVPFINGSSLSFTNRSQFGEYMMGLSTDPSADDSIFSIDHAIAFQNGDVAIFENGVYKGSYGTSIEGDIFEIAYKNNLISYYKNKVLFESTSISPSLTYYVDSSFLTVSPIITISNVINSDQVWETDLSATFTKADCKWDEDSKIVVVSTNAEDDYTGILNGIDKEFNLIKIAPELSEVDYYKRPLVQIYTPGDSVVSCFLMGSYWEQDVSFEVTDVGDLVNDYFFAATDARKFINVTGSGTPIEVLGEYARKSEDVFVDAYEEFEIEQITHKEFTVSGSAHGKDSSDINSLYKDSNDYTWRLISIGDSSHLTFFSYYHGTTPPQDMPQANDTLTWYGGGTHHDNVQYTTRSSPSYKYIIYIWQYDPGNFIFESAVLTSKHTSGNVILTGINPNGTGTVTLNYYEVAIYARLLTEVESISSLGGPTNPLPIDDIVADNRNYSRAIGYDILEITDTTLTQVEPTEYGRSDNGDYFIEPDTDKRYYPIARSTWGESSIWYNVSAYDDLYDTVGKKLFTFRHAYLLSDVIEVLLDEIFPSLEHLPQVAYSEFLYGDPNPVGPDEFRLLLTQKSNVLAGEFDRPAQKAPITLKGLLDMLKNVFQLYWFIDGNKFRIEHISWFKNGGSYTGSPSYTADLTALEDVKNNKKIGFAQNKYEFEVSDLGQQLEFSWMDNVTGGFEGHPIKILSNYVRDGKVDQIPSGQYTTDMDYMLLNPSAINQDGFALMAATIDNTNLYTGGATNDERLDVTDGTVIVGTGYRLTPYMDVKEGEFYTRLYGGDICWYSAESPASFIAGETNTTILTRVAPTEALFCRCAVYNAYWGGWSFVRGLTLDGTYQLPFIELDYEGAILTVQNGYLSWLYLHDNFWAYDLPGKKIVINGIESPQRYADGIIRTQKQIVKYPSVDDPDPMKLVKTDLGDGQIQKISVNLSSGMNEIELRYDTE